VAIFISMPFLKDPVNAHSQRNSFNSNQKARESGDYRIPGRGISGQKGEFDLKSFCTAEGAAAIRSHSSPPYSRASSSAEIQRKT